MWLCPKCWQPLDQNLVAPACPSGHCYDRARQGYLNLLLANKKNSRNPGDNAAMVEARSAFLRAGFYAPLAKALQDIVQEYLHGVQLPSITVADIGCGEGYYLEVLSRVAGGQCKLFGIDISKPAIRKAAVFASQAGLVNAHFAVASTYEIPLPDRSLDIGFSVFAPFSEAQVCRVLKPKGILIRVSPGPRHLYQLKQTIYPSVRLHSNPETVAGCELEDTRQIDFMLRIPNPQDLENLLAMTPFNWHGHSEARQAMLAQSEPHIEASFCIQILRPNVSDT